MGQVIRIEDQNTLVPTSEYPHAQWSFTNFNPIQSRVFEIYKGDSNICIAAATAAGKTATAEMFMAHQIRTGQGKAIYIGPLKSLARQKYENWTKKKHHFNDLKISVCTGDYRITNKRTTELDEADIIIMTPEMLASRTRNHKSEKSNFLKGASVVIFDEAHLLTVPSRGDHIEIALMKLTEVNPNIRVVLLSATMPNVDEICGWICKLTGRDTYYLDSKFRPVPLSIHYETYFDGDKKYDDVEREKIGSAIGIINYFNEDKFLAFVHTKRTGQLMVEHLKRYGVEAEFHNADLDAEKRIALESRFETDKNMRVVVATSTLAWGVEFPARRVIITGVDRGLKRVENYDIWQMAGRAGRPAFDPRGDVYILVPESKKTETIAYLRRKLPITSQLLADDSGHYKTLAFHVVSEIHQGNIKTKEAFHYWFRRSLAHYQKQDFNDALIDEVIELLEKNKAVVTEGEEYKTTSVGVVASMFYFSPFDAAGLKENFKRLFENHKAMDDYNLSIALANIDSYRFGQVVNKAERSEMAKYQKKIDEIFGQKKIPESVVKFGFAYYNMLNGVENATFSALQSGLRTDCERTLEVLTAIDTMSARWKEEAYFKKLRQRLQYGAKWEYLDLVQIPNVGRVRAEKLYTAGVRTVDDFLARDENSLSALMNVKVDKVKESLDGAREIKIKEMTE